MTAGRSPLEWAARERKAARRGVRRKVLAWAGLNPAARRADALTARVAHGVVGEQWTAERLARLPAGWTVLYGRKLPGYANDYDAVVVPPNGAAVIVVDTKRWRKNWQTTLQNGLVYCGPENRHDQVEKVARHAARLETALGVPGIRVWPLLVVHGSTIRGGRLEARARDWAGIVHVLGPDWLVPTLMASVKSGPDPAAAAWLAGRVNQVLPP